MMNATPHARKRRHSSFGNWSADIILVIIMLLLVFICLAPLIYQVALSFSSIRAINSRQVFLWPVDITTINYARVFRDSTILISLRNSVLVTISHTVIAMIMTILCAYPLTKKRLHGRRFFSLMILFTMMFNGGIIPDYLLIKTLGMNNSLMSLVIPCAINTFNMIILRTFFVNSIPQGIEDAAVVDGCNDMRILISVVLPLSLPVLATLTLFYAVARWNGFQDAKFFINKDALFTLPQRLNAIINSTLLSSTNALQTSQAEMRAASDGVKAASIVVSTLPILLVYPWLQRYFVNGVMIGAIKE